MKTFLVFADVLYTWEFDHSMEGFELEATGYSDAVAKVTAQLAGDRDVVSFDTCDVFEVVGDSLVPVYGDS
jgi:hypothetical protein